MNFDIVKNCNRYEKVSVLKLIIKIASADGTISGKEQSSIEEFLNISNLKTSSDFISSILEENIADIVAVFTSRQNVKSAMAIVEEYANTHSIHPELEGKILDDITFEMGNRVKTINFSFMDTLKAFGREFSTLWGQESIHPELKRVWAIILVLVACVIGSFMTDTIWGTAYLPDFFSIKETSFSPLDHTHVIGGLLIYGALATRKYLPAPTNFRNVLFFLGDNYLLSIFVMYVLGDSGFEKSITLTIFGGVILLFWIGMKELMGFFLIASFSLVIYKLIAIDNAMEWRAYPFIMTAFLGLVFQSKDLFSDFSGLSNSFFKESAIDKEIAKESLEMAGSTIKKGAKVAMTAATGL